jgi:hypothetical protein
MMSEKDSITRQEVLALRGCAAMPQSITVPPGTLVKDNYAIRVADANQRSRREDFDVLVREIACIGKSLVAQS